MPNYPWLSPHLIVQAEKAEEAARPALSQRRWTDKDDILTDYVLKHDWPTIPKGVGADFEGERFLRVFVEVRTPPTGAHPDGRVVQAAPNNAVLVARLFLRDAVRAGLVARGSWTTFLVVPVKFFLWVAGALSFDKKVLLSLGSKIERHGLDYDDAEIGPEVVWITPMRADARKYCYAVLSLVGMGGVINSAKGNPSFFAGTTTLRGVNFPGIQPDPLRHTVWWLVDRVIDAGITSWGDFALGRNGQEEILAIKLELVHFLRGIVDYFVVESFEREIRRGAFDRGSVEKAIGKGLWHHLPVAERITRENEWLERADRVSALRIARATRAGRLIGFSNAAAAILKGFGEGWAADLGVEADRLVALAMNCVRHNYFAKAGRGEGMGKDGSWFAELAEEGYEKGDLLLEDAREIDRGHELHLPTPEREKELYDEWLRDMEDQLQYILGPQFPH